MQIQACHIHDPSAAVSDWLASKDGGSCHSCPHHADYIRTMHANSLSCPCLLLHTGMMVIKCNFFLRFWKERPEKCRQKSKFLQCDEGWTFLVGLSQCCRHLSFIHLITLCCKRLIANTSACGTTSDCGTTSVYGSFAMHTTSACGATFACGTTSACGTISVCGAAPSCRDWPFPGPPSCL